VFTPEGSDPSRRFGSHIAIAATSSCPLSCAHCITRSGPDVHSAKSTNYFGALARFLKDKAFDTEQISITGGEPFYNLKTTRELVSICKETRHVVTNVTSGFWAKTEKAAVHILSRVPSFDTLVISCDPHHARFVPNAFIENAYRAAKSINLDVRIRLVQSNPPTVEEEALENTVQKYACDSEIERQLLLKYGRAADLELPGAGYAFPEREYCPSSGPYIDDDGSVLPCCSSIISIRGDNPLKISSITDESAEQVRERFLRNGLFATLKIEGAPKLRAVLRPALGDAVDTMAVCDLCYAICSSRKVYDLVLRELDEQMTRLRLYAFGAVKLGMVELIPLVEEAANELVQKPHV
jgi:pyruvate-formate lyase-activating enzyme